MKDKGRVGSTLGISTAASEIPTILSAIQKNLEVITGLLIRACPAEGAAMKVREQVKLLSELGLRPRDIARVLGKGETHVNKELVFIRKGAKRKE